MCGITGIIGRNFNHTHLDAMVERIAHRGPDGRGKWQTEGVSLGHLRLSIIDLSDRAAQPMHCNQTGNVIVFNGEIYNYKELKAELSDYSFRSDSDTEVILAAYATWGVNFLSRLRGMYSIALYDNRSQNVLLARDRLGIKPLYYRTEKGACLFSSEIKGILNVGGLPHSVNSKKVLSFLSFRHLDTDNETFFNEVFQVPGASYCWVDLNGKKSEFKSYWHTPVAGEKRFSEKDRFSFREKLIETIQLHLRSDVPVGSFMSGGLDSSSIACIAYDLLKDDYPLETFSSILEEKTEENALIPLLQKHLKHSIHHEIHLMGQGFLEELPKVIYHHDEPLPDASMFAHFQLCKLANQNGIKVLLSGNGGDEVLGGYACHIYALLGRNLKNSQFLKLFKNVNAYASNRNETRKHLLARSLQESLPFSVRNYQKKKAAKRNSAFINADIDIDDINFYPRRQGDPWQANYENNINAWTIPPFLHYEDRNSMAFGVEIRVPMLDHEFIEYMAEFDPESLVKGRSKNILRTSLKGLVPNEVLDQKGKYGFPAPLEIYTRYDKSAFLKSYLEQIKDVPFLNPEKCERLGRDYIEKNQLEKVNECWRIYTMSIWYHQFFD